MKVIAFMSVYNEERFLEYIVDRLVDMVDEVHIVDGAYEHFPHVNENGSSDDKTAKISRDLEKLYFNVFFHPCVQPWKSEIEKRNYMFNLAKEGDWILIIDGDEIPGPELDIAIKKAKDSNHGFVGFLIKSHAWHQAPRLLRVKRGMKYEGNHFSIMYNGVKLEPEEVYHLVGLLHVDGINQEKNKAKQQYYVKLLSGDVGETGLRYKAVKSAIDFKKLVETINKVKPHNSI